MSDVDKITVTVEDFERALKQLERPSPLYSKLIYWATPSQYNDPDFMRLFAEFYPDVDVKLSHPLPV